RREMLAARPRLRRLTALTPSAHRSVGFASARSRTERDRARSLAHRVATGIPFLTASDHDVEDDDQLAHAGDEGDLLLLALGNQAIVESLEYGVVLGRGPKASHVEEIADLAASALDVAFAAPAAAVVIVRRGAEQGGTDLVIDLTQFRHFCDQSGGSSLGKAGHALDDLGEFRKTRRGFDHGRDYSLELGNLGGNLLQQPRVHFLHRFRPGVLAPV